MAATDGSLSSSQTITWTVNPYVSLTNPGDQSNVEGNTISLQLQATDAGGKTLTYSASNLPGGLTLNSSTGLISGTVSTGDSASSPYSVTVSATDGTYTSSQVFAWIVTHSPNPTPSITNPGNQANNEGDVIALQITASDSDGDPLTYSATGLPDGLNIDPFSGLISGTLTSTAVSKGPSAVTVTVDDNNGATASQSFTWMANDAALAAQGVAVSATEGTPLTQVNVATFTDPNAQSQADRFTATITWGDGSSGSGILAGSGGSYSVLGSHTYSRPGSYTVSVTIADNNGSTATTSSTATVAVAPLSVSGVAIYPSPLSTFTVATFTDANPNDPASSYTATINWGDGTGSTSGHVSGALGAFIVGATHTFPAMSSFTVSVTVTDKDNTSASATTTAVIAPVVAGATATVNAGLFSLTGPTPTATITWGDGNSSSGTVGGQSGSWSVSGSHIYVQDGTYTVTITVTNSNGSQSASNSLVVARAYMAEFVTAINTVPNVALNNVLVAVFTEGNPYDTSSMFSATINWGDGTASSTGTITGSTGLFQVLGSHTYTKVGLFEILVTIQSSTLLGAGIGQANAPLLPKVAVLGPRVVPQYSTYIYHVRILRGMQNISWSGANQLPDGADEQGRPVSRGEVVFSQNAPYWDTFQVNYQIGNGAMQSIVVRVAVVEISAGRLVINDKPAHLVIPKGVTGKDFYQAADNIDLPDRNHQVKNADGTLFTDQQRWNWFLAKSRLKTPLGINPEDSIYVDTAAAGARAITMTTTVTVTPPDATVNIGSLQVGLIQHVENYESKATYGANRSRILMPTTGEPWLQALDWALKVPWPWYPSAPPNFRTTWTPTNTRAHPIGMYDTPRAHFPKWYNQVRGQNFPINGRSGDVSFKLWVAARTRGTTGDVYDRPPDYPNTPDSLSSRMFFAQTGMRWQLSYDQKNAQNPISPDASWHLVSDFPYQSMDHVVDLVPGTTAVNWGYVIFPPQ